jgi:hypothetical protein
MVYLKGLEGRTGGRFNDLSIDPGLRFSVSADPRRTSCLRLLPHRHFYARVHPKRHQSRYVFL